MECLHPTVISGIVTNALQNSGVSKEILKRVQQQMEKSKSVTGKVQAVITNANERKIMVGSAGFEWFFSLPIATISKLNLYGPRRQSAQ